MKIYVSGPISNMPDGNKAAFKAAADALREKGYEVINPHENGLPASATWAQHMRADIKLLMDADGVALLAGWRRSRGATIERWLAFDLGIPCSYIIHWLDPASERQAELEVRLEVIEQ